MLRKVAYLHNDEISGFSYPHKHPMKPIRIAMTDELINVYGLFKKMHVYQPHLATLPELKQFHNSEYIDFLSTIDESNLGFIYKNIDSKICCFNIGESHDCQGFKGLFEFSQMSAGGSIDAAKLLMTENYNVVINWTGGLHHARKKMAAGFCFINDIVLCILELLKMHERVLYLDLDVHHGDGVEDAFLTTNRVMKVSFHQYGEYFFPGTGFIDEIGEGPGEHYSLNIPLKVGIGDDKYLEIFKPIMDQVVAKFRPQAIVIQCGADSLGDDKLGSFCLTVKGHLECVNHMLRKGIPTVLLGGGGYKISNVPRLWVSETAAAIGVEIENQIPPNFYSEVFKNDNELNFRITTKYQDLNTDAYLNTIREKAFENLRAIPQKN